MKFSTIIMSGLCLGLLSGCGNENLSRKEALTQLQAHYVPSTRNVTFELCSKQQRISKHQIHNISPGHPCTVYSKDYQINRGHYVPDLGTPKYKAKYDRLFVDSYPILLLETLSDEYNGSRFNGSTGYGKITLVLKADVDQEKLIDLKAKTFVSQSNDKTTITIDMYDYKIGNITGIRQRTDNAADIKEGCDAIVEYTPDRFNFAPWGQDFLTQFVQPPAIYSACFQKFDDGWRLKPD